LLQLLKHGIHPESDNILCHVACGYDIVSLQLLINFSVDIMYLRMGQEAVPIRYQYRFKAVPISTKTSEVAESKNVEDLHQELVPWPGLLSRNYWPAFFPLGMRPPPRAHPVPAVNVG
jgi:hypothetical protein